MDYYKKNISTAEFVANVTDKEETEVQELVKFFKDKRLTRSIEVSKYIVEHKLGYKFPNISGKVTFESHGVKWDLEGDISPKLFHDTALSFFFCIFASIFLEKS